MSLGTKATSRSASRVAHWRVLELRRDLARCVSREGCLTLTTTIMQVTKVMHAHAVHSLPTYFSTGNSDHNMSMLRARCIYPSALRSTCACSSSLSQLAYGRLCCWCRACGIPLARHQASAQFLWRSCSRLRARLPAALPQRGPEHQC